MKSNPKAQRSRSNQAAFTLVEMLVVIAIIAVLAALIFPVVSIVNKQKVIARTKAQLVQVETAVETYKTKLGFSRLRLTLTRHQTTP